MSPKVVGVLLIVTGLLYALLYVRWLRRPRTGASTTDMGAGTVPGPAAGQTAGPGRPSSVGSPRALTLAWAEGTYIGTTKAVSRQERVASAKEAVRAPANMVVDDSFVRWERDGADDVIVAGTRLLGVSLDRDPAGRAMSRTNIIRVSWHTDNGDRQTTGFLPRNRADSAALVLAVEQLMKIGASVQDAPAQTETGAPTQVEADTTPDGTP